MPFPLVPVAIVALTASAYAAQSRRKAAPLSAKTRAERAVIYETLVNDVKDPEVLRRFSQAFREQGCNAEADMLMKRALLREQPADVKKARNEAFRKGMASKDPAAIRSLAAAFEETGATGAAAALRDTAEALERGAAQQPGDHAAIRRGQDESNPGIGNEESGGQ